MPYLTEEEQEKAWAGLDLQTRREFNERWDEEWKHLHEGDGVVRRMVWRGQVLEFFFTMTVYVDDMRGLPKDHPIHEEETDCAVFVKPPSQMNLNPEQADMDGYLVFAYRMGRMADDLCPKPNDTVASQVRELLDRRFPLEGEERR